jgi:preprotein translocase subunit SecB
MATLVTSPVQPVGLWTLELEFKVHEDTPPQSGQQPVPKCQIGTTASALRDTAGQDAFQARLTIEVKNEDQDTRLPFEVRIVVLGLFTTINQANFDRETKWRLLIQNGLNLTYGHARGELVAATSRSPFGAFVLPALQLQELGQDLLANMSFPDDDTGLVEPDSEKPSESAPTASRPARQRAGSRRKRGSDAAQ